MSKGGKRLGAGRKKGTKSLFTTEYGLTLSEIAKCYTEDALQTLVDIMNNVEAPCAARATCANSILDRAWGKPAQPLQHTGKDGESLFDLSRLNDNELAEYHRLAVKVEAGLAPSTSGNGQTAH